MRCLITNFSVLNLRDLCLNWERGIVKKAAEVNGRRGADSREKRRLWLVRPVMVKGHVTFTVFIIEICNHINQKL